MAITYESIATTTLSTASANIEFTSIPGTYTDLVLAGTIRSTRAGESTDQWTIQINGDTGSNYSGTSLDYGGSSRATSSTNFGIIRCPGPNATSGVFGYAIVNFMNYSNTTTYKTALFKWSEYTFYEMGSNVGLWRNTNAITSLKILSTTSSNLAVGTSLTLYGIKAA